MVNFTIPTYRVRMVYQQPNGEETEVGMRVPQTNLESLFHLAVFNGSVEFHAVLEEEKWKPLGSAGCICPDENTRVAGCPIHNPAGHSRTA